MSALSNQEVHIYFGQETDLPLEFVPENSELAVQFTTHNKGYL